MMIVVLIAGVGGLCVSSSLAGGLAYSQNWLCDSLGENFGMDCTATPSPSDSSTPDESSPPGPSDDKDDKKYKKHCVYLYEDKDGKKFLVSKCTKSSQTYKGSKLDGMSSLRVGEDLKVYVYDKNGKKKTYKGKKDKVYNLSGKWNNDTKKLVLKYKKSSSSSSSSSSSNSNKNSNNIKDAVDKVNDAIKAAEYFKLKDGTAQLFNDRDFNKKAAVVRKNKNISNLATYGINDKISSIRVAPGYKLQVWEDKDYSGKSRTFSGNTSFVGWDWNDKISSVKLTQ
jgi:hypothetical protein